MNTNNYVIIAVIILAVGGGAFYGGMQFQKSKTPANPFANGNFQGRQMAGQNGIRTATNGQRMNGGGMVSGEILKKDAESITVKMRDGSTKLVLIGEKTSITKSTDGKSEDLEIGKDIMANGTASSDGSVVAEFIQIRPSEMAPVRD